MRMMLESTEGVVAGLAANDMQAVEQAAARAAPSAPGTVDQELHASLPEAFLHSGAAAHGGFEDIARLARQAAGTEALMRRLGETLHQCTSCHAAYRVEVAR
jgi:cytochrome c556